MPDPSCLMWHVAWRQSDGVKAIDTASKCAQGPRSARRCTARRRTSGGLSFRAGHRAALGACGLSICALHPACCRRCFGALALVSVLFQRRVCAYSVRPSCGPAIGAVSLCDSLLHASARHARACALRPESCGGEERVPGGCVVQEPQIVCNETPDTRAE